MPPSDLAQADAIQPDPVQPLARVKLYVSISGLYLVISVADQQPILMLYDTGAPFSYLIKSEAERLGLSAGEYQVKLEQLELGPRRFEVLDHPAEEPYEDLPPDMIRSGTVGNSFFADYSVGLNYRDQEIWLWKKNRPEDLLLTPQGVGAPVTVLITQPLGYLLVGCSFEDVLPSNDCLFDTGSPDSMALEPYWSSIEHPDPRKVPTYSRDVYGKLLTGYYQRSAVTRAGEFSRKGDYVAVFESFPLLDSISEAINHALIGLVGVYSTLTHFTVIDYPNARLRLYPYQTAEHLPASPFIGFGMVWTSNEMNGLEVRDVVMGSAAATAGVQAGDVLKTIDGVLWWQVTDLEFTIAGLIKGDVGQSRSFALDRGGEPFTVDIAAEDLLPPLD